jgi:putative spermidine/putrescine transport system permease protein
MPAQSSSLKQTSAMYRVDQATSPSRWLARNVWLALTLPAAALMLIAFVYPIARMLLRSVFDPGFTTEHYRAMVEVDAYAKVLINTFRISLVVTLLSIALGYPFAYVLSHARGARVTLFLIAVILPLWTTELVRSYAWTIVLGRVGPLNWTLLNLGLIERPLALLFNATAVYIGAVHIMLPFIVLPMYSVMRGIDPRLVRAAQSLGASPLLAFIHVYLPLSLPGVVSGALLVFVLATGFFVTPSVLGNPDQTMVAMMIESQGRRVLNWGFAAALSTVLLAVTVVLLAVYDRIFGIDRLRVGGAP